MSFVLERDMYATTLAHLPALLGMSVGYAYGLEVPLSYKVADIGLVPLVFQDSSSAEARALARLSQTELWVLAQAVGRGRIYVQDLPVILGRPIRDSDSDRMAESLCRAGLLEWGSESMISATEWLRQLLGPIAFVELKLSRWKQALNQAMFYLENGDYSCVVLDGDAVDRVPRAPFVDAGIGLFAGYPGCLEMLIPPRPGSHLDASWKHFNRLRAMQDLSRRQPRKWVIAQHERTYKAGKRAPI